MELTLELWRQSEGQPKCPHVAADARGPYCSKNQKGDIVDDMQRMVCDAASLQLWCLDAERYHKCIIYQEGN